MPVARCENGSAHRGGCGIRGEVNRSIKAERRERVVMIQRPGLRPIDVLLASEASQLVMPKPSR